MLSAVELSGNGRFESIVEIQELCIEASSGFELCFILMRSHSMFPTIQDDKEIQPHRCFGTLKKLTENLTF